jgi:transposase
MNTKLHAVTDANGRPISLFMTAGQVGDYTGAAALLDSLPKAQWLFGDRGYDADWFRDALQAKVITTGIPGRKTRAIHPLRQAPLQAAQPHRNHVPQAEGLAAHRHPLRSAPPSFGPPSLWPLSYSYGYDS